jgi:hypothetical protein
MWTPNSVLLAAEAELLDEAQYLEIHEGGGTWAIQTNVVIGGVAGAFWTFTAPLVVNDISGHVVSGKTLMVDVGGQLNVSGLVQIAPRGGISVLGAAPSEGGVVEIGQYASLLLDSGATLTASAGSLINVSGNALFENGASWRLMSGARGNVDGGGLIYLMGAVATTPAQIVFQQYAQQVFWATTNCQFLTNSLLSILPGATAQIQGVLDFVAGATITGVTTLVNGAALTVAGTTNFSNGSALNLQPNCTVYFDPAAQLTGSPLFLNQLRLGPAAQAIFNEGSTFLDGSYRTFSEPQLPSGLNAVIGVAPAWVGPLPPQGQTYVDVDASGLSIIDTPTNLPHPINWTLTAPSRPEVARFLIIRQPDQTKQGGYGIGVWFQNTALVTFAYANPSVASTSAALLFWNTTAWTFVFAVGANAVQG